MLDSAAQSRYDRALAEAQLDEDEDDPERTAWGAAFEAYCWERRWLLELPGGERREVTLEIVIGQNSTRGRRVSDA
jgi:hypothetical protein